MSKIQDYSFKTLSTSPASPVSERSQKYRASSIQAEKTAQAMKELHLIGEFLLTSSSQEPIKGVSELKERINVARAEGKWFNKIIKKLLHFVTGSSKAITNKDLIQKINYFVLNTDALDHSELATAAQNLIKSSRKPQEIHNFALKLIKTIEQSPKENLSLKSKITKPPSKNKKIKIKNN